MTTTPQPHVRLSVKRIPKAKQFMVNGTPIVWQWSLTIVGREDDPAATFTSGYPTKPEAVAHVRELAATYGYSADDIEENF